MKIFKHKNGIIDNSSVRIMGILNITPDSFSDGGLYFDSAAASAHADKMIDDGADIIDIGAMSTRPGSEKITFEREIDRLERVLYGIREKSDIPISIDTVYPETADFALENGADMINDVTGVFNGEMASVAKKHGAGWIVMHNKSSDAGDKVDYKNGIINDISDFFDMMISKCVKFGIPEENLCLDPGFGFGKNTAENIDILKNTDKLSDRNIMYLTALSRKRFIGDITGETDASKRDAGTLAADLLACLGGSDILRVHDVKSTHDAVEIFEAWRKCNG